MEVEVSSQSLRVTITADGAGHAVPTGDPFRALRFAVHVPYGGTSPVLFSRALRRTTREVADRWVLVEDTRIPPPSDGETRASVTLDLPLEAPLPTGAFARLTYEYADPLHHRFIQRDRVDALLAEVELEP